MGCCCFCISTPARRQPPLFRTKQLSEAPEADPDSGLRALVVARLQEIWGADEQEVWDQEAEIERFAQAHERLRTMATRLSLETQAPEFRAHRPECSAVASEDDSDNSSEIDVDEILDTDADAELIPNCN